MSISTLNIALEIASPASAPLALRYPLGAPEAAVKAIPGSAMSIIHLLPALEAVSPKRKGYTQTMDSAKRTPARKATAESLRLYTAASSYFSD